MRTWIGLIGLLIATSTVEAQMTGNLNFTLGQKQLHGDWDPLEQQGEFAVAWDFKPQTWPVSLAFDLMSSSGSDDDTNIEISAQTTELHAGVRKIFDTGSRAKPFIGGGLAFASAALNFEVTILGIPFDDTATASAVGLWGQAGCYWGLGDMEAFNLGFSIKHSVANSSNVEFDDFDVDIEDEAALGGTHIGLLLGWHY